MGLIINSPKASSSAPEDPEPLDLPLDASAKRTLRIMYLASTLHGMSDACAKVSTPGFVFELFGADFVASSAFLAMNNVGMSVAEFLLNPLLGQLSDRYGRRLFLLLWPPINTLSRLAVIYYPVPIVIFCQQVLVKMLEYTFEKAMLCACSDFVPGDQRSVVAGNISMLKLGVGFLCGSGMISAYSTRHVAAHRFGYYVCAACTAICTALLVAAMPETLAKEDRRPVNLKRVQPLSFLRLLNPRSKYNRVSNGAVWRLALVAALAKGTNKGVEQCINVHTVQQLAWSSSERSRYKIIESIGGFVSGRLVGPTMAMLGKRWTVLVRAFAFIVHSCPHHVARD